VTLGSDTSIQAVSSLVAGPDFSIKYRTMIDISVQAKKVPVGQTAFPFEASAYGLIVAP
jgi:hypothetical protein